MAIQYNIAVNVCEVCGHRWLPKSGKCDRCANQACRSRGWNASGHIIGEAIAPLPTSQMPTADSPAALFARLGLTTASKMLEQPPPTISTPVEDDETALPMCSYTEYDTDSGETYRCGLRQHSCKVKHTRGNRV